MTAARTVRGGLFVAVTVGLLTASSLARAADPSMSECLSANESAIKLRADHKLREAREQSLVCASASCPGAVRDVCQGRIRWLTTAIPSVVFAAHDANGNDVVSVAVSMDGNHIADRLDGTPLEVDPGQHTFRFVVPGQPAVDRSLVVSEGQQNRRVVVAVGGGEALPAQSSTTKTRPAHGESATLPESAPAEATSGASRGGAQRAAGIAVGVVGLAGLAFGGVTGALTVADWSRARDECSGKTVSCTTDPSSQGVKDKNDASTMATLSTVGFIAGGVLTATGIVVYLTAPRGPSSDVAKPSALELVPAIGPGGASVLLRGAF